MGSILYLQIAPQTRSTRYPGHLPSVSMDPESPDHQPVEFLHRHCPAHTLATCWELLFATFCSLLVTSYTLHHEERVSSAVQHNPSRFALLLCLISQQDSVSPSNDSEYQVPAFKPDGHFGFILDPPPALMLGACLVLGCAISSFAYRRQEQDKLQTPIFLGAIALATTIGFALGTNANLIMLGMIPWGLCSAMVLSTFVHWMMRRCSKAGNRERRVRFSMVTCCELERGEKEVLSNKC
jgi:hypothetical protein